MVSKTFLVLLLLFGLQLCFSCVPCECPEVDTVEVEYKGVHVTAYDTSGFQNKVVGSEPVFMNAFGLSVSMDRDFTKIATTNVTSGFGFSRAMACDCTGPDFRYRDPVTGLGISVTDVLSGDIKDVTGAFLVSGYNRELISLDELFNQEDESYDGFQLELADFDSIPLTAIFTVEALLQSGRKHSMQTDTIYFHP